MRKGRFQHLLRRQREALLSALDARVVAIDGPIEPGDGRRFTARLAAAADRRRIILEINSPGGILRDAEAMAQAVERVQVAGVRVTARVFGECNSAAVLPLAAAVERESHQGASLLIHGAALGWDALPDRATAATLRGKVALLDSADQVIARRLSKFARLHAAIRDRFVAGLDSHLTPAMALDLGLLHRVIATGRLSSPAAPAPARLVALTPPERRSEGQLSLLRGRPILGVF